MHFIRQFALEIMIIISVLWILIMVHMQRKTAQGEHMDPNVETTKLSKEISIGFAFVLLLSLTFLYPEIYFNILYFNMNNGIHERIFYSFSGFITNPLFVFFKIIVVLLTIACLLCATFYFEQEDYKRVEYPLFMVLALLAILYIISSSNLVFIYLALEFMNFCVYLLISAKKTSIKAIEASLRYFTYSSYASAVFLLGISLIYGLFGTVDIVQLHSLTSVVDVNFHTGGTYLIENKLLYNLALFCMVLPLMFKFGLIPQQFWMPEVYEGSPFITAMYISTVPKMAYFLILIKILIFSHAPYIILLTLTVLSVATIIIATLLVLYERSLKRFLAYSTIINMAFVILSLSTMTITGIQASISYFIIYIFSTVGLFLIILLLNSKIMIWKKETQQSPYIYNLKGMGQYFFHGMYLFIVFLNLAGIPPFAGFFIKLEVLMALFNNGNIFIALVTFLFSIILATVYLRVIRIILLPELTTSYDKENMKEELYMMRESKAITIFLVLILILFIILYPIFFFNAFTQFCHYLALIISSYV